MHATFFEPGRQIQQAVDSVADASWRRYGSGLMSPPGDAPRGTVNPLLVYPRAVAEGALEQAAGLPADPFDDVVLEYRNPLDGGPAMTTMGMRLQRLRAGVHTRARRHTGSKLYHVVRGSGSTIVDGQRHDWNAGDFLAVRPWAWHEHVNEGRDDAMLFQVNDFPAMAALGYYFEEPYPDHDGHQPAEQKP
jgi:gentisate 1,2-dioxygenase